MNQGGGVKGQAAGQAATKKACGGFAWTGPRAGQRVLPRAGAERSACSLQGSGGGQVWRRDHLDTHHIVSFVENHDRPLQVDAVCPATLQQERKEAGLEPRGTRQAGEGPRATATWLYPPPRSWTSGPDPHHACRTATGWRTPKAGARRAGWGPALVLLGFDCTRCSIFIKQSACSQYAAGCRREH